MNRPKRPRLANRRAARRKLALKGDAGAFTLSYVIIVPVFLFGIMTVVQASIWYLGRETVLAAARHGADVARTSQPPPGQGAHGAMDFASSSSPGFLKHISASTKGSSATTVRVSVRARIPTFVPGLAITVHEVVTAPVERFVADPRLRVVLRGG